MGSQGSTTISPEKMDAEAAVPSKTVMSYFSDIPGDTPQEKVVVDPIAARRIWEFVRSHAGQEVDFAFPSPTFFSIRMEFGDGKTETVKYRRDNLSFRMGGRTGLLSPEQSEALANIVKEYFPAQR